jgi:hypothetical protein
MLYQQDPRLTIEMLANENWKKDQNESAWIKINQSSIKLRFSLVREAMIKKAEENKKAYDKGRKEHNFEAGELVMIATNARTNSEKEKHKKLKMIWIGPMKIKKISSHNNIIVEKEGTISKYYKVNVETVKRFYQRP